MKAERDMSEAVTQRQFYEEMQRFRVEVAAMHTRQRDAMAEGFRILGEKLDQHKEDDDTVELRVAKLEYANEAEQKASIKRGAWAAILVSAGVQGVIQIAKGFWK